MSEENTRRSPQVVFRGATRLYVIVSLFMSFFVILGLLVYLKQFTEWRFLAIAIVGWLGLFVGIAYLRLELTNDWFRYRNLSTNCTVHFSDVERAYFCPVSATVAQFRIMTKQGRTVKMNLRTFPIEAAAVLFSLLDMHHIPIDVPGKHWGSVRMARQIRECQSRIDG